MQSNSLPYRAAQCFVVHSSAVYDSTVQGTGWFQGIICCPAEGSIILYLAGKYSTSAVQSSAMRCSAVQYSGGQHMFLPSLPSVHRLPSPTVLYCAVLYNTVLCSAIQYCNVQYNTILHCIALALHYSVVWCNEWYYIAPYCSILNCNMSFIQPTGPNKDIVVFHFILKKGV